MFNRTLISFLLLILGSLACLAEHNRYLALADSAQTYIQREKWDKAESLLIEALREEPAQFSNAMLFSNLGIVRMNMERYEEALEAFDMGLNISPGSTVLLNNRSNLKMILGKDREALNDLNKSLEIDASQEWALQMKAMILISLKEYEEARKVVELFLQNFPENSYPYFLIGRLAEINGDDEEAIRRYKEALSRKDLEETRSLLILLFIKNDLFSDASSLIRESIEFYPENPYFYLWRGYLNKLNYRNEEAEADKKMALALGADIQLVEIYLPTMRR